jgi:Protein of unknown function (DUF3617)
VRTRTLSGSPLFLRSAHVVAFLAVTLAVGTVRADEWPTLRAGMWEFDRTIETSGASAKPKAISTKSCTNPGDDMKKQNEMLTKAGCVFSPVNREGNTYAFSAVCKLPGASGTSKSVLNIESDSAYTIRIESDLGGTPTRELLIAKRIGTC